VSNASDTYRPPSGTDAASELPVDLGLVTLFVPTTREAAPEQIVELQIQAPAGPLLAIRARVVNVIDATEPRGPGLDLQLLDISLPGLSGMHMEHALQSLRPPSLRPPQDRLRVLVVDDDPLTRMRNAKVLKAEGYTVLQAGNGVEALSVAVNENVAAIVSDITMPLMDGWKLLRMVRNRSDLAEVPVLFLTARANDQQSYRGYALGVDDYISKPADPKDLINRIRRAVRRRESLRNRRGEAPLLQGDLARVSLGTLLSLLGNEKRTGRLVLTRDTQRAEVALLEGLVMGVDLDSGAEKREALQEMFDLLDWNYGEFELLQASIEDDGSGGLPANFILLEHARQSDERA